MNLLQAFVLGIIQGLTEFIPVSSSGHLIVFERWLGVKASLGFDVALHIGTLIALLVFFRKDFWELGMSLIKKNEQTKLAWILAISLIPAVVAGVLLQSIVETAFRSEFLVAVNLIMVAFVMLAVDRLAKPSLKLHDMTPLRGFGVGLAQALAIVPGVSRSGITITAGLAQGFDRVSATRFSFLLSAPIIVGAILKVLAKPENIQQINSEAGVFTMGIIASMISGYLAIKFLIDYLAKHGLAAFAYYRIALGLIILVAGLR